MWELPQAENIRNVGSLRRKIFGMFGAAAGGKYSEYGELSQAKKRRNVGRVAGEKYSEYGELSQAKKKKECWERRRRKIF